MIDHETQDSYTVTVTATDPSGASDSITLTIEVVNVDEAPVVQEVEQLTGKLRQDRGAVRGEPDG